MTSALVMLWILHFAQTGEHLPDARCLWTEGRLRDEDVDVDALNCWWSDPIGERERRAWARATVSF